MATKGNCSRTSKWIFPVLCVAMGGVALLAYALGGQVGNGLFALGLLTVFGLVMLLAGRSDTIRGLRGDGRDERFALMDMRATALTGLVLILALIAAWLTEIARGHSGRPYDWLLAAGGIAYLLAVGWQRWRG